MLSGMLRRCKDVGPYIVSLVVPEQLMDEENTEAQKKRDSTSKNAPQACL